MSVVVSVATAARADELLLYVSPQGDDGWSGTLAAPNAERSDGPLATLRAARNAVRERKRSENSAQRPIRVLLRGGVYQIDEPLVFGPEDSAAAAVPITYAAYQE